MSKRIGNYLRQQHLALAALFLVLAGGTALAASVPRNSVKSSSVKDNALKSKDLKDGKAVNGADVVNDSLKGADVDEASLDLPPGGPPSGPAGGDLTGSYPNPQIAANSVTGAEVTESTLGQVPSAALGGIGRTSTEGSCDPESETFVVCAFVTLTLPGPSRVLVIGWIKAHEESDADRGFGDCRIGTTSGPLTNTTVRVANLDQESGTHATVVGVTPPLGPGSPSFGIDCNQFAASGAIQYEAAQVSAVALSPN